MTSDGYPEAERTFWVNGTSREREQMRLRVPPEVLRSVLIAADGITTTSPHFISSASISLPAIQMAASEVGEAAGPDADVVILGQRRLIDEIGFECDRETTARLEYLLARCSPLPWRMVHEPGSEDPFVGVTSVDGAAVLTRPGAQVLSPPGAQADQQRWECDAELAAHAVNLVQKGLRRAEQLDNRIAGARLLACDELPFSERLIIVAIDRPTNLRVYDVYDFR